MDYSRIGQREGEVAFNLLGAGFAGSGWESQSIYALYNVTAVSTTYILAWCQNHSIPVYSINQANLYETLPRLHYPGWLREWIKGDVLAGNIVITPDRYVTIEKWHGTGWAVINPETGLGAYYILGGLFETTEEIKALEESLGPGDVAVGGTAAIVILMWLYSLLMGDAGGSMSGELDNATIEKWEDIKGHWSHVYLYHGLWLLILAPLFIPGLSVWIVIGGIFLYLTPLWAVTILTLVLDPEGEILIADMRGDEPFEKWLGR
jgi:hypothetical protein